MLPNQYKWEDHSIKDSKGSVLEQILKSRGIETEEEIRNYLHPTAAQLHNPFLLTDMERSIKRIRQTKIDNESIVIYGDYDVDGVTSTSILYMFLKEQGYDVSYYIPNRQEEGYGLNKGAIEKISKKSTLMITVDTGIAAIEEVCYANTVNLDVIITDHHECQEELPKAYAIINPKRADSKYPFMYLAGVGVTFKLIHALAIEEQVEAKIWKYIDIVALGTVADVVPLEGENRVLTALGFKQMLESQHIGLKALLDVLQLKELKINSNVIGFQMGPRINAAGRLSDAKIGVELLTTTDEVKAKEVAQILDQENKKRQDMEAEILEEAEKYIEQYVDVEKDPIIIVAGKNWHHGVIGIVASRIMGKYYKPTIILTLEDGIYSGSARSVEGFNIFDALCHVKDFLVRFGGHEMAAGLSLEEKKLEAFTETLLEYGDQYLTKELLTPKLAIDAYLKVEDLTLNLCEDLEKLEPFGAGNPAPIFCVQGDLQYAQAIGQENKHLKLSIQQGHAVVQGIGFNKGDFKPYLTEGESVEVAFELSKNIWNNRVSAQMRLLDIKTPPLEKMISEYYLALYHQMKEPPLIPLKEIQLMPCNETHKKDKKPKRIAVFTEQGLIDACKWLELPKKDLTQFVKICYNEDCDFTEKQCIIVVPSMQKNDFNVENYDWNFKDPNNYVCIKTSLQPHREQLSKMVPSYSDCRAVYKLIRSYEGAISLHKAVQLLKMYQMSEYKLLQALDIFAELGLIDYQLIADQIVYKIPENRAKTQLDQSKRYRHLQAWYKSMGGQS